MTFFSPYCTIDLRLWMQTAFYSKNNLKMQCIWYFLYCILDYTLLCRKDFKKMANVAYIRVSTVEQNEDRQLENLKQYQIDRFFSEKVSGKDTKRPQLQEMLRYVREGDTVYINDFSRLARSTMDLLSIVDQLQSMNVQLVSLKENIDTSTPTGKLMLQMIAAINEFERANLLERQREGIRCAKERGAYKGRKKISVPEQEFSEMHQLWLAHKISKSEIAKRLNVSRTVVDRMIGEKVILRLYTVVR